ncbi:FecR family protein [Filimonas lacunae]|uniref:FecR family protein n=1 Tax=Filimonas lacunae TaxID=477680 RepID=A0A173MGD7_9BACT|nr:FecR family protein [Filimonas lacunae]BAV06663.1 anti-sigma factor [Filimonas lacunae]SIT27808.1 FecR family protein [Filimonas lacunae]
MKDYNTLVKKFWAGDVTETEKLRLYKMVMQQEENARVSSDATDHKAEEEVAPLTLEESQHILEALHRNIQPVDIYKKSTSRTKVWKLLGTITAAAAVILLVIWANRQTWQHAATKPAQQGITAAVKTISNPHQQVMTVRLDDSSQVNIYPGGSISYPVAFLTGQQRVVQLTGKANFKVQHNARKPFQVIAMQIKTTDIGTEFCIDAQQSSLVKIHLKEGSVKVESLQNSHLSVNKLLEHPGEELSINFGTREVKLASPVATAAASATAAMASTHATPAKTKLSFHKTPLSEVFTRLAHREQVKIRFNKAVVNGLTFTGNIEPGDSLENTLDILCSLNGLSFIKTEQGIEITGSK